MFKRATKKFLMIAGMSVGAMLFATQTYSQQGMPLRQQGQPTQSADYSEEEIEKFIEGNQVVQTIQKEKRPEMMQVIEKQEGMDMQTFNQIAQAQQQGGGDFSEEKMAAFQEVSMKLQKKQQEMQQEMAERLPEEAGISMKKFQEMMMAYRQNPEFQKEVQAKMQN
ncbi:DUF4168 domain-containing protein [Halocola ammonii]